MPSELDNIISQLETVIGNKTGFQKKAGLGEMSTEPENLSGTVSEPEEGALAKELPAETMHEGNPVDEGFSEEVQNAYTIKDPVEKSAAMANALLNYLDKSKGKLAPTGQTKSAAYKAGEQAFQQVLNHFGPQNIVKSAQEVQRNLTIMGANLADQAISAKNGTLGLLKGASLADASLVAAEQMTKGAELADMVLNKQLTLIKGAQLADAATEVFIKQAQDARNLGANIAERLIEKLAADIVAVRGSLQKLVSDGVISSEERDSLASALGSADQLNEEAVRSAASGVSNSEAVISALLEHVNGVQGANTPIEPAQPAVNPVQSPETANVSGVMPGDLSPEETMIVEAAYNLVRTKVAKKKGRK